MVPAVAGLGPRPRDYPAISVERPDRPDPDGRVRRAGGDRRHLRRFLDLHPAHFLAYGLALLPFFVFDYYFYAVEPMLTPIGLLDAVGNVIMLWLCWIGWSRSDR